MTFSFPDVPGDLRSRNVLRYLRFYGPGAILASVTIGTGETVLAARGGALFGYTILWCLTLGALFKGVQTYAGLRFLTLTGFHPVRFWARLRGPRGWFPILMGLASLVTLTGIVGSLPKFLATLIATSLGTSAADPSYSLVVNVLASVFLLGCGLLALGSTYRLLELSQTAIVLLFLAFVVAAFVVFQPGLLIVLKHLLVPGLPRYPDWALEAYPALARRESWLEVMIYMGMIGGSGSDYLGYLTFVRDKGWGMTAVTPGSEPAPEGFAPPSEPEQTRGSLWLRAPLVDVAISFGCVVAFSTVFLVLGAVILSPLHQVPHDSEILFVQANFLTRLHPDLFPLYFLGIVMVFLGTVYGTFEIQARALNECLSAVRPEWARLLPRIRLALVSLGVPLGLGLIWSDWDPLAILSPASILSGVFACGLWCFVMAWTERKFLPRAFWLPRPAYFVLLLGGGAMTVFGLRALYDYALSVL
jgi:hypothetical protein